MRSMTTVTRPALTVLSLLLAVAFAGGTAAATAATPTTRSGAVAATAAHVGTPATRSGGPRYDFAAMPHRCRLDGQYFVPVQTCHITSYGRSAPVVVAWGDSHMAMYLPALRQAARATHTNLVVLFAGGCPPVLPEPKTAQRGWTSCENHDHEALHYIEHLKAHGRHVRLLLGAWWDVYRARYLSVQSGHSDITDPWTIRIAQIAHDDTKPLFDRLGFDGIATDVMAQPATVPSDAHACPAGSDPYQCRLKRSVAIINEAQNRAWVRRQMTGLTIRPRWIDTSTMNCSAEYCRPRVQHRNVYYDPNHYGAFYAHLLTSYFLPTFRLAATS